MDWGDLAKQIVMLGAPTLGQALGGPFGGMAGKILAGALGATQATPAAVNQALIERPPGELTVAEAVQKAESEWLTALTEIGKAQVTEVAETQRAEIVSEDPLQRWWRPLYALELSFLECPVLPPPCCMRSGAGTKSPSTALPTCPGCSWPISPPASAS
jgi:hypothetical protein